MPSSHVRRVLETVRPSLSIYVEEASVAFGWSAEVLAKVQDWSAAQSDGAIRHQRIGGAATAIPSARDLEREVLPQVDDIVARVVECF